MSFDQSAYLNFLNQVETALENALEERRDLDLHRREQLRSMHAEVTRTRSALVRKLEDLPMAGASHSAGMAAAK